MDEQVNSTPTMADYYGMIKAEHEANNAWSAEQAQKAMDYQTQMSNTAHQREVADLKAAGLNPILSAGGQGATTGSGAQGQRADSNVDALYGLTKMAIESNIAQANAMANTAKYSSGHSGSSNSFDTSSMTDPVKNSLNKLFGIFGSGTDGSSNKKSSSKSDKSNESSPVQDILGTNADPWNPITKTSAYALGKLVGLNSSDVDKMLKAAEPYVEWINGKVGGNTWQVSPAGQAINNAKAKSNSSSNQTSGAIMKGVLSNVSNSAKKVLRKLS